MEARAIARYVRMSPRKVRKVVELIRGKSVSDALTVLHFMPHRASLPVEKVLRSAAANAVNKSEGGRLNPDDLVIKRIYVDEGPFLKRFRAASLGRASMIRRRSCHITVVVSDEKKSQILKSKQNPKPKSES